jgi:8-oxo-dGTP diphosphatase
MTEQLPRRRIAVVAAVLQQPDGRFLLAQRPPGKAYAGYWEFPGGKVEDGETPATALSRELHEELGIDVISAGPWLIREFDYPHAAVRLHFFRVRAWRGELQSREGQAFAWQRLEAISVAPLLPANGPILQALGIPETYGITGFTVPEYQQGLGLIENALRQGLRLIQVRGREWPPELFGRYARDIIARAHACGARVLVNADIALAQRSGADGVHLTAQQLRDHTQRPDCALVGASCHNTGELRKAEELGVDFAVLGPVLPTPTHPDAVLLGWAGFQQLVAGARIPVFALGGLQAADREQALVSGAHGLAMVRGAWVLDRFSR